MCACRCSVKRQLQRCGRVVSSPRVRLTAVLMLDRVLRVWLRIRLPVCVRLLSWKSGMFGVCLGYLRFRGCSV